MSDVSDASKRDKETDMKAVIDAKVSNKYTAGRCVTS